MSVFLFSLKLLVIAVVAAVALTLGLIAFLNAFRHFYVAGRSLFGFPATVPETPFLLFPWRHRPFLWLSWLDTPLGGRKAHARPRRVQMRSCVTISI